MYDGEAMSPPFGQEPKRPPSARRTLVVRPARIRPLCLGGRVGRKVLQLTREERNSARFSPDGQKILTACMINEPRMGRAHQEGLLELDPHLDIVLQASFRPRRRFLATAVRSYWRRSGMRNRARNGTAVVNTEMGLSRLVQSGW